MTRDMGLRSGWSLDLTTQDVDGKYWGFTKLEMRNRAVRKLMSDKPILLIGSPTCIVYSVMNNVNHARVPDEVVRQRSREARVHLEFCAKFYHLQREAGRYLLHEHLESASSWQEDCINDMLSRNGVLKVTVDQCRYGLKSRNKHGEGFARNSTSFMTNSPCIAERLKRRYPNRKGTEAHKHVTWKGGRTRAAQVYPPGFCKAICLGLKEQLKADKCGQFVLMRMDNEFGNEKSLMEFAERINEKCKTVDEEHDVEMEEACDDVSGKALDPKQVKKARKEEIEYVHKMGFYVKVPVAECFKQTGKALITVRWIDINKGDNEKPNYRFRLIAREINTYKRGDFFAATPPLEALKIVISMAATGNKGEVIMINDISRAYFHARAERDVYVRLPDEDRGGRRTIMWETPIFDVWNQGRREELVP